MRMTHKMTSGELYQELRGRILNYEYRPGEPLPIRKLAADLGVGTMLIREALFRLEGELLIERPPNGSARVPQISYKDLRDIFEVRLMLERQCGALAAHRITETEKAACRKLLALLGQAVDLKETMQIDARLHDALYAATRNGTLQRFSMQLRHQVTHLWYLVEDEQAWCRTIHEEWRGILDAVFRGDEQESKLCLEQHVRRFITEVQGPLQVPDR